MKQISDSRVLSDAFKRFPRFFLEDKPNDGHEYISMYGKLGGKRLYRWVRRDYIAENDNLEKFKVMLPAANGSGALGESLATPLIGQPLIGHTETFISIGPFDANQEAEAALKYIKTKYARCMLGVLKITQHNSPEKWAYVPLQDFTSDSDIDWSQSVADIDRQLYAKYCLDEDEISFIESHVKEMD